MNAEAMPTLPAVVCRAGPFWCPKCRGYIQSRPVDFGPPRNWRWVDICGCRPELLLALAEDEADAARQRLAEEEK